MPWKPGQTGNPGGAPREKQFLAALERAVKQDDGKKLRSAADKLLECASNGEPWAIQQLADRLDGKPTQQVDMTMRREVRELDDSELQRIAAGGSAGASEEKGSAEVSKQLH